MIALIWQTSAISSGHFPLDIANNDIGPTLRSRHDTAK
jgi:hypothetical protein